MTTTKFAGDAVASYQAFERASDLYTPNATIVSVMSLFALLEAAVLYERVWYLPFGDKGADAVARRPVWSSLASAGLVAVAEDQLIEPQGALAGTAKDTWRRQVADLGHVPSYSHVSSVDLLDNTYRHALGAQAQTYAFVDDADVLDFEGLKRWEDHVTGVGFDQAAEDANQGDDNGRYMNWERTVIYMARASVVRELAADYVGDGLESPIIQVGDAIASRNAAVRLYAKVSRDYGEKIEELKQHGYAAAMAIPPIVALVLDRCDGTLESIVSETAALRQEFAPFRAKYRAYSESLQNPAGVELRDLVKARRQAFDEVGGALKSVSKDGTDSSLVSEVVKASLKPSGKSGQAFDFDASISLNALVKVVAKVGTFFGIRGRARILFDSYDKAMRIKNLHSLIGKRLRVDLTQQNVDAYQRYVATVERLTKVERKP